MIKTIIRLTILSLLLHYTFQNQQLFSQYCRCETLSEKQCQQIQYCDYIQRDSINQGSCSERQCPDLPLSLCKKVENYTFNYLNGLYCYSNDQGQCEIKDQPKNCNEIYEETQCNYYEGLCMFKDGKCEETPHCGLNDLSCQRGYQFIKKNNMRRLEFCDKSSGYCLKINPEELDSELCQSQTHNHYYLKFDGQCRQCNQDLEKCACSQYILQDECNKDSSCLWSDDSFTCFFPERCDQILQVTQCDGLILEQAFQCYWDITTNSCQQEEFYAECTLKATSICEKQETCLVENGFCFWKYCKDRTESTCTFFQGSYIYFCKFDEETQTCMEVQTTFQNCSELSNYNFIYDTVTDECMPCGDISYYPISDTRIRTNDDDENTTKVLRSSYARFKVRLQRYENGECILSVIDKKKGNKIRGLIDFNWTLYEVNQIPSKFPSATDQKNIESILEISENKEVLENNYHSMTEYQLILGLLDDAKNFEKLESDRLNQKEINEIFDRICMNQNSQANKLRLKNLQQDFLYRFYVQFRDKLGQKFILFKDVYIRDQVDLMEIDVKIEFINSSVAFTKQCSSENILDTNQDYDIKFILIQENPILETIKATLQIGQYYMYLNQNNCVNYMTQNITNSVEFSRDSHNQKQYIGQTIISINNIGEFETPYYMLLKFNLGGTMYKHFRCFMVHGSIIKLENFYRNFNQITRLNREPLDSQTKELSQEEYQEQLEDLLTFKNVRTSSYEQSHPPLEKTGWFSLIISVCGLQKNWILQILYKKKQMQLKKVDTTWIENLIESNINSQTYTINEDDLKQQQQQLKCSINGDCGGFGSCYSQVNNAYCNCKKYSYGNECQFDEDTFLYLQDQLYYQCEMMKNFKDEEMGFINKFIYYYQVLEKFNRISGNLFDLCMQERFYNISIYFKNHDIQSIEQGKSVLELLYQNIIINQIPKNIQSTFSQEIIHIRKSIIQQIIKKMKLKEEIILQKKYLVGKVFCN